MPGLVLDEPPKAIALVGRLAPAGPRLQIEIVLLSLPDVPPIGVTELPTTILPVRTLAAPVEEPNMVQLVIKLLVASFCNRIVEVRDVALTVVLEKVSALPPLLSPFIVTLSEPSNFINGCPAVAAPEIVQEPPEGEIVMLAHVPAPRESHAPAETVGSVVLPITVIMMLFPVWEAPLIAVKAAFNVEKVLGTKDAPVTLTCAFTLKLINDASNTDRSTIFLIKDFFKKFVVVRRDSP